VLVGSARGHHLLKLQLDSADPTRVVATERLLADRVGPMRAVTIGPDGAVYFATDGAIGRLGPESTPAR
jgi:glucose/arabinose dehydrogenase